MLGRLEMDVDACIAAYVELMKSIFSQKTGWFPINILGKTRARFDSSKLEGAIKEVISRNGGSADDLFNDGFDRGCKVSVIIRDSLGRANAISASYAPRRPRPPELGVFEATIFLERATLRLPSPKLR
jgi:hypothetical protein